MNRLFLLALTIALTAGAATVFTASDDHGAVNVGAQQTGAAYRDGMYLAKLDRENGRKPHLSASRWTSSSDRTAFLSGYEAVYGNVGNAYAAERKATPSAEATGFHDGLSDGLQHRQSARQFQVGKTDNYRRAGRGEEYRQAYVNGYQRAFYGQQTASLGELSQQATF